MTTDQVEEIRRMNRREASEAALRIILSPTMGYDIGDYDDIANRIFKWLQEEKK
jgi:hypothetical protein